MKRLTIGIITAWLSLVLATPDLRGQTIADVRATSAVSTQKFAGSDLDMGFGFGATLARNIQPHLAAYGGWDWLRFHATESFAGSDRHFQETGYTLGLRFEHPFDYESDVLYRIELGGTYKHVEVENVAGELIADSGHLLGVEVSGGIVVPLGRSWRVSPTIRLRSMRPEFEIEGVTSKGDLRYVGLEAGMSYRF